MAYMKGKGMGGKKEISHPDYGKPPVPVKKETGKAGGGIIDTPVTQVPTTIYTKKNS